MEENKELPDKILHYMMGDKAAALFCLQLVNVAHLWDDLIDKDRKPSDKEINEAFQIMLLSIPSNPFYVEHREALQTLIQNAILQWKDANVLERGSDHDKHMAYMLRASITQIFNYCAFLIGGQEWTDKIGPEMRRMYEEPLESFMEEMQNA